jgi:hypothetical protein
MANDLEMGDKMITFEVNNVREALPITVEYLISYGLREQSRGGDVYAASTPVTILYHNPKQHVLLSPIRDANPFFHLMEAMWMLAGRLDGAFLDNYVKNFSQTYGSHGLIPDAYGYRWRHGLKINQLDEIVAQLRRDHTTRQCVLQMWGASDKPELFSQNAKPCNLVATFRIVDKKLDMSIFNRSNDVIWGCCGANAVHFAILQEYMAGKIGVEMGNYWQISTNLHLYLHHIKMMAGRINLIENAKPISYYLVDDSAYGATQPLMTDPQTFDNDLYETMAYIEDIHENKETRINHISNEFLRSVVIPMAAAHQCYKNKDLLMALTNIEAVAAEDWRAAGRQWIERRSHERRRSSQT